MGNGQWAMGNGQWAMGKKYSIDKGSDNPKRTSQS
jgi:hypothetical protein